MDYQVTLTAQATEQIREIVIYISQSLQEPIVAKHWADMFYNEIAKLCFMPSRYLLVEEEPWRTKGIRKMPVKNFIVYYWVDEENKRVFITAVIYGRRDQLAALSDITQ